MNDKAKTLATFADAAFTSDMFFCVAGRQDTFNFAVDGDLDEIAELIANFMSDDSKIAELIHKAQNIYLASQIVDNEN